MIRNSRSCHGTAKARTGLERASLMREHRSGAERPPNVELELTKPAIFSVCAGFAARLRCSPDRIIPARPPETEHATAAGEVGRGRHRHRPVGPPQPPDANVHFSGVLYPAVRVVVAGPSRWVR